MIILHGNGSDLSNPKAIERRARCKIITQTTMLYLIDIAKERRANERIKAYWNTYHCQNKIYTANGKVYTTYCKNRFCTHCCGIRKAELINKYLPVVKDWEEPFFITLTVKAVTANKLQARIKDLNRGFRLIVNRYRKRKQRGQASLLMGLKTVECNFNPDYRTYNPHIHLLVASKEMAELIIREWLALWTRKYAHPDAQHFRKVEDREKDLIEVIKYETKIFTEPGTKRKPRAKAGLKIYAKALDNIYAAMKGCRIVDRFGFNLPKDSKKPKAPSLIAQDYQTWEYHSPSADWLNEEHESPLTAYVPPAELTNLLEFHIDSFLD